MSETLSTHSAEPILVSTRVESMVLVRETWRVIAARGLGEQMLRSAASLRSSIAQSWPHPLLSVDLCVQQSWASIRWPAELRSKGPWFGYFPGRGGGRGPRYDKNRYIAIMLTMYCHFLICATGSLVKLSWLSGTWGQRNETNETTRWILLNVLILVLVSNWKNKSNHRKSSTFLFLVVILYTLADGVQRFDPQDTADICPIRRGGSYCTGGNPWTRWKRNEHISHVLVEIHTWAEGYLAVNIAISTMWGGWQCLHNVLGRCDKVDNIPKMS